MAKLLIVCSAVVVIAVVGWLVFRTPPLEANEIRVTYEHGETCLWRDWSFRIRREVQNNRARGAVMIVGRPTILTADDDFLRVFTESGEKLTIAPHHLSAFEFETKPDSNNSSNNKVTRVTVVTKDERIPIAATYLERLQRDRVLIPVASRYWREQSDDYMQWGNVRMTLAGDAEEDCSSDREISLTRPGHPKKRTPVHVEFPGK